MKCLIKIIYYDVPDYFCEIFQLLYQEICNYPKIPPDFCILEAKEKYGELRVYCSHYIQEIENLIENYAEVSKDVYNKRIHSEQN